MSQKGKKKQFAKFIMHNVPNAPFFFNSYMVDGNEVYLKNGTNKKTNEDIKAVIQWPKGKRIITLPVGKKDHNQKSFVDFIRESPYCRGSENCEGEGLFFEFDPQRDAKIAMDEERVILQATSHAMSVEGDELLSLAAYCGITNEDDEHIMRNAVYNFAKMKPREYNEVAKAPDLTHYALVRSCVSLGIVKKRGYAYDLNVDGNTEYLGKNEAEVVARLRDNKVLTDALKEKVEQAKE